MHAREVHPFPLSPTKYTRPSGQVQVPPQLPTPGAFLSTRLALPPVSCGGGGGTATGGGAGGIDTSPTAGQKPKQARSAPEGSRNRMRSSMLEKKRAEGGTRRLSEAETKAPGCRGGGGGGGDRVEGRVRRGRVWKVRL
jgi:hypothetical protein